MNESNRKYATHPKFRRTRSESGSENVHYPLMCEGLTEEDRLYARRVLNETEENKAKGMKKLKEYMKEEGLTCPDDSFLVMVLRNCKYDIPKSETKLKRFLRVYQLIINKLAKMDMEKIEFILEDFPFGYFPWRDSQGRQILYTRPNVRIGKYEMDDIIFFVLAQVLFVLQFPLSSIYGLAYIGDNKAPSISYYQIFKGFHQLLPFLFDMPYRISRVDVINEHFFSRWLIKMILPFVPAKIRNRLMFHGSSFETLHKIYHPDILPDELGGTLGPISSKYYQEDVIKFIKRMKEINQNI